jgi:hypothetical protein
MTLGVKIEPMEYVRDDIKTLISVLSDVDGIASDPMYFTLADLLALVVCRSVLDQKINNLAAMFKRLEGLSDLQKGG